MLKVCRKEDVAGSRDLTAEEDHALRAAFERFAKPEARSSGSVVVRRFQHSGFGNRCLCDCLAETGRFPALGPVLAPAALLGLTLGEAGYARVACRGVGE
jgi:hypothetical protein